MEKDYTVEIKHSAKEVGSGDLEVLSTPSLIAFMENTAKAEVAHLLEANETTVGIAIQMQHIKATAIGKKVRIHATLLEQNKNIFIFEIEAYEEDRLIGTSTHKRAIVDTEKFLKNLS